jgi:glycosyltransferase involved in cell wall biosynthesis
MGAAPLERVKYYMSNDAVFYYAMSATGLIKLIKKMRRFPVERHKDKTVSYPPVFFGDVDDNIHFISPINPKFKDLGTRDEKGVLFKPGEEVWIVDEAGERHRLWKDGEHKWDVKKAQGRVKLVDQMWQVVDGMSFTTERLRAYYAESLGLANTFVYPNSVLFEDYPDIPIQTEKGTVKVLWQGGDAHYGDWYGLRPVLPWTANAFPEVRWVIFGSIFPFIHKAIPKDQLYFIDWVPYDAYKTRLATIDFDFMVIPLVENQFNVGKSAIKWYEVSALPRPKPVLAARVPPFSDEIIDGETGLLYGDHEEFKVKFEALVRDGDLRARLAKNAKEWMGEYRDAYKTAGPLYEWIVNTIDGTRGSRWPLDARLPKRSRKKGV